jgi:hypothetical protein
MHTHGNGLASKYMRLPEVSLQMVMGMGCQSKPLAVYHRGLLLSRCVMQYYRETLMILTSQTLLYQTRGESGLI